MAGSRIRHFAEFRPPCLCFAQLHHGRSGLGRCVEKKGSRRDRRLLARHACRGSGPYDPGSQTRISDRIRGERHRIHRSSGDASRPCKTAVPLVVRHAPMYVEAQGCPSESALRHARFYCNAERLDLPGALSADITADGPYVHLVAHLCAAEPFLTPAGIRTQLVESEQYPFLLRLVPRPRLARCTCRIPDGKEGAEKA